MPVNEGRNGCLQNEARGKVERIAQREALQTVTLHILDKRIP